MINPSKNLRDKIHVPTNSLPILAHPPEKNNPNPLHHNIRALSFPLFALAAATHPENEQFPRNSTRLQQPRAIISQIGSSSQRRNAIPDSDDARSDPIFRGGRVMSIALLFGISGCSGELPVWFLYRRLDCSWETMIQF